MNKPPEKMSAEELHLIHRAQIGDPSALEALTGRYAPLIIGVSRRFYLGENLFLQRDDLVHSGYVGLLAAISHYHAEKGVPLGVYALAWILGEMKKTIRAAANHNGGYDRMAQLRRMQACFERRTGRTPTLEEAAEECGMSVRQIVMLLNSSIRPADDEISKGAEDWSMQQDEGNPYRQAELRIALDALKPEERQVILLRYFRDHSQAETAKIIGKSQTQISRIERRALDRLKDMLSE